MITLLLLVWIAVIALIAAALWRRPRSGSRAGAPVLVTRTEPAVEESAPGMPGETPRRHQAVNRALIVLVGALLWFGIDSLIWLLRPPLPPSMAARGGLHEQVTSGRGIEALPALSADGEWIAYRSDHEGTGDILLRRLGDESSRNLTRGLQAEESDPAISPDGRHIAFRSTHQNGGIFLVNRSGEGLNRLTNFGASPSWTPDGRSIVFATRSSVDPRAGARDGDAYLPSGLRSGGSEGWIVNVATRSVVRISRGDFRQPAVSPDGRRVAYWAASVPPIGNARRRRDGGIYTIAIDGSGGARLVTPARGHDWNPVWSPDGEFLYFLSDRDGRVGIWRVTMDMRRGVAAGQPVPMDLRAEQAAALSISRDGRRLAWSTAEWSPTVLRIDYDADARLTRGAPAPVATGALPLRCAEPSPDGESLAAASDHPQADLYVIRRATGHAHAITSDAAVEGCPRWSPDGQHLAFHYSVPGSSELWIAEADGGGARRIAGSEAHMHPVWAPDGRALVAVDLRHRACRIFRVSPDGSFAPSPSVLPNLPQDFVPAGWSPDGRLIVGLSGGALWTYDTASLTHERLMPGGSPTWLRGGRRLIFAADGRLILLDVPTKFVRELLAVPELYLDTPHLTADERQLFFSRNTPEANLWVATLR